VSSSFQLYHVQDCAVAVCVVSHPYPDGRYKARCTLLYSCFPDFRDIEYCLKLTCHMDFTHFDSWEPYLRGILVLQKKLEPCSTGRARCLFLVSKIAAAMRRPWGQGNGNNLEHTVRLESDLTAWDVFLIAGSNSVRPTKETQTGYAVTPELWLGSFAEVPFRCGAGEACVPAAPSLQSADLANFWLITGI